MGWQSVIIDALSVTSILSIIAMVRFWKQNKKLKENEVKVSDANTQTEQINLGDLFMQKSAEMFEKMQKLQEQTLEATQKNGDDNADIIKKVSEVVQKQHDMAEVQDGILQELKRQADEQSHLVAFVNGEYQDFLARNGFKKEE